MLFLLLFPSLFFKLQVSSLGFIIQELNVIGIRAIILRRLKIEIISVMGFLVNFSLEFFVFSHCIHNNIRRCESSIHTNLALLFSLVSVCGLDIRFETVLFSILENERYWLRMGRKFC